MGPFIDEWKSVYGEASKDLEEVDIASAVSAAALSAKDETELRSIRNASKACTLLMSDAFVDEMSEILDEEKKVTHEKMADNLDAKLEDKKFFPDRKSKLPSDFTADNLDWAYGPVIQSGGKYDFKLTAVADKNNLRPGTIIAGLGLRYKSYCSMVARTYLVDPNKSQENAYKLLLAVHDAVIKEAKVGVAAKDLYNKAISIIRNKKSDLEQYFVKNVGAGIGIETRDGTLILNGKTARQLKDGMTLCITTGFSDIKNPDPQDKASATYSLLLSDTVRIKGNGSAVIFTASAPWDLESTSFFFKDDEEDAKESPKAKSKKDPKIGAIATSNITKSKLRAERTTQADEGAEARRRAHQKELAQKKQAEGLERYSEAMGDQNGVAEKKFKKFESYKRDNQLPSRVKDLVIVVDQRSATVLLPIMGRPVPFHINTIKNASHNDEGEFTYLRINFLSPGQGVGRKDDQPFEDPNAHFVRSLTFRSTDKARMGDIATQITDLRKSMVRREQEKKEMEDVVEQDKLSENRKPTRLETVFVRPAMDGKRVPGQVELHLNGLRYRDHRGNAIDVLFSNIKHLFFQPCKHELIVLIHIHLKNPIMIGKKKTKDVQFYREATDMQFDETGNRKRKHRLHDDEEFEMEQEERRRRALLDKEFKTYAEKIENATAGTDHSVGVDVPFRELGFNGVPFRSNVYMQPTTSCIVQLTEPPFTVITLDEIEVAHLERVQFGLKNFDMVFVFKDFHRPPAHINTIPVESLEPVKDWLDSIDIPISEGPLNLNWATIMKTVTADPHQFFADGGWSFLAADSDDEDQSEEEEESAFEMDESELEVSDESSEADSDFDENASDEASADGSMDDDESGEDWDELEKKAKKKDRDGGLDDDEGGQKRRR